LLCLVRLFSVEARDCSENNITASNFVKSASGDLSCTKGEEKEEEEVETE
jgi:hypothetical protein